MNLKIYSFLFSFLYRFQGMLNSNKIVSKENIKKQFDKIFEGEKKGSNISLENVSKVYPNGIRAVDSASIKIKENEFLCLLGPSGCGKTTILRMISGLEDISSGLLKFNNNIMNSIDPGSRNLSMVFQNYALYPFMTVYKNISFGLKIKTRNNWKHISLTKEMEELSNIIKTRKKLLKHELKMLSNPNLDIVQDIKTALKIKKKTKNFDYQYKILEEELSTISKRNQELLKQNKNRISFLEKKKKYIKYIFSDEITKLIFKKEELIKKYPNVKKYDEQIKSIDYEILKLKKNSKKEYKKIQKINLSKIKKIAFEREKNAIIWKLNIPYNIETITKMLGINNYLNRKPSELSGGQRQRVALARAISKNSSIFLYDEPLSNLDAKLRSSMRLEIRKIHNNLGATTIYVTHDQVEAMTMADKVVVMNLGYIQQIDSPQMLYNNPANIYVATFIGTPQMNVIKGEMKNKNIIIKDKSIEFSKKILNKVESKNILMGIRPNDIITNKLLFERSNKNILKGKTLFIENTGKEKHVFLETKIGNIITIFDEYNMPKIGENVEVMINPSKIHIFDEKTGIALTSILNKETIESRKVWDDGINERISNKIILFNEKNKFTLSIRMWRQIGFIFSPKKRKEYKKKMEISKKEATRQETLVDTFLEQQTNFKNHDK